MEAQNKVLSAHWATTRERPRAVAGYRGGSGWRCSSTSAIRAVSQ